METANKTKLPVGASTTVSAAGIESPRADYAGGPVSDNGDFRSIIGSPMCAACITRHDSLYRARSLVHYAAAPMAAHMAPAKRVLCYLIGMPTLGLVYHRQQAAVRN